MFRLTCPTLTVTSLMRGHAAGMVRAGFGTVDVPNLFQIMTNKRVYIEAIFEGVYRSL